MWTLAIVARTATVAISRWVLNVITGESIFGRGKQGRFDYRVRKEAEIGAMGPEAKECQQPPGAEKSKEQPLP